MKRTKEQGRGTHMVLSRIDKLDAAHRNLILFIKDCFDRGIAADKVPALLNQRFGVSITIGMSKTFRTERWVPEKEFKELKIATTKSAIEAFGGDTGLDAAMLAKLWEMMDQMTVPQIISARTLFIKTRAQNLKEQEFLYKTGQWKPPHAGGDVPDPETQQRNVLRRIKEIFGLAGREEEEEPETPQLPAAPVEESAASRQSQPQLPAAVEVCEPET